MSLTKFVDSLAIVLLLALVGTGFMVMKSTTESNLVTADIALIQAKNKRKVLTEVGLLTAEVRILQKDIEGVREKLKKKTVLGDMAK